MWTSTLARAVQTAEIVAAALGVGVTTREGLRELGAGEPAAVPATTTRSLETYQRWLERRPRRPAPRR